MVFVTNIITFDIVAAPAMSSVTIKIGVSSSRKSKIKNILSKIKNHSFEWFFSYFFLVIGFLYFLLSNVFVGGANSELFSCPTILPCPFSVA